MSSNELERWIREKSQNSQLCTECGGQCCKRCGCSYFPKDLDMSFTNLSDMFEKKLLVIDWVQYNDDSVYNLLPEPIYYCRVPNITDTSHVGLSNRGNCIYLTPTGCMLSYDERPTGGKLYVPFWSGCYTLYKPQEFIDAWTPYQDLLKSFINENKPPK